MKKIVGCLFAITLLSIVGPAQSKNFDCDGGISVRANFYNNWRNVRVRFNKTDVRMTRRKSEEGSVYQTKGSSFWVNGNNARLKSKAIDAPCKAVEVTNLAATVIEQYICEGGTELSAEFYNIGEPKRVRIKYGTQDFTLPLVRSGSGSKYTEDRTTFWIKGKDATLVSQVLNSECKQK